MIQKGKTTITAGNDTVQVNYAKSFSSTPVVNISCKENVNVYLIEATNTYIILNISNALEDDLEINYVAIEKSV